MKFSEISTYLREQSSRYGGIKDFLAAADALDKALSSFFTNQTVDSLKTLNGAHAHAWRCYSQARKDVDRGPVAK